MQLPSGMSVSDKYLRDLADSIVCEHASYGFEDWQEAIHSHGHLIGEQQWNDEGPIENEEDRTAVIEAVEPVARAFTDELAVEHQRLYDKHIGGRTW